MSLYTRTTSILRIDYVTNRNNRTHWIIIIFFYINNRITFRNHANSVSAIEKKNSDFADNITVVPICISFCFFFVFTSLWFCCCRYCDLFNWLCVWVPRQWIVYFERFFFFSISAFFINRKRLVNNWRVEPKTMKIKNNRNERNRKKIIFGCDIHLRYYEIYTDAILDFGCKDDI